MQKIVSLLFFTVLLFAADCEHCAQKFKDAIFMEDGVAHLYLGNANAITTKSKDEAIYNKFLNLYLVTGVDNSQAVELMYPYSEESGGLYRYGEAIEEVTIKRQCGLRQFGSVDRSVAPLSIVSGLCCDVLGVANENLAIIDAKYLKDFIKRKSGVYGDIGVRFNEEMQVKHINPYYDLDFEIGDTVIGYDSVCELEDSVLFASPGTKITYTVKREGKQRKISAKVHTRYGGGFVSDSFLEQFGLTLNQNMVISTLATRSVAKQKGLKVGDRLLRVENHSVKNRQQLKEFFTKNRTSSYNFLFERGGFQFFVRI